MLFNSLKLLIRRIKHLYALLFHVRATYLVEEIDTNKNIVTLHYRGRRTVIKLSLESIIADAGIICGLSSEQACLLGGYFGRAMKKSTEIQITMKHIKKMSFFLTHVYGRYKIVYQNRQGEVGYFDTIFQKEFCKFPLDMVNCKQTIENFDPSQACYIGILAGISIEKSLHSGKTPFPLPHTELYDENGRPKFRVIK